MVDRQVDSIVDRQVGRKAGRQVNRMVDRQVCAPDSLALEVLSFVTMFCYFKKGFDLAIVGSSFSFAEDKNSFDSTC